MNDTEFKNTSMHTFASGADFFTGTYTRWMGLFYFPFHSYSKQPTMLLWLCGFPTSFYTKFKNKSMSSREIETTKGAIITAVVINFNCVHLRCEIFYSSKVLRIHTLIMENNERFLLLLNFFGLHQNHLWSMADTFQMICKLTILRFERQIAVYGFYAHINVIHSWIVIYLTKS